MKQDTFSCPCGSGQNFHTCCGPFVHGDTLAQTAEQLMRSRYTAYVQGNVPHLLRTWHPSTRPTSISMEDTPQWCGLQVQEVKKGRKGDRQGEVTFQATYMLQASSPAPSGTGESGGVPWELHTYREKSCFVREGSAGWLYLDGQQLPVVPATSLQDQGRSPAPLMKTANRGRNSPCPCGSGKKYKRCCLHR